ncbi:MAG: ABC transporter ATP-binding protein [bacterium]|nr:ABC transporter ATP-binding protein [bacterium]
MMDALLSVRNLQAWYDESQALFGVDLDVREGEVVTLAGRNGVGKTTTLKAVMGMLSSTKGSVTWQGHEILGQPSHRIARLGIGVVPEERGIFSQLTVRENLMLPPVVAEGGWSVERIYQLFPILEERKNSIGTKLSGGEQQMLAIARILRSGARLILMDEPTEGLAPVIVNAIRDLVLDMKRDGITVLLVEQNLRFATKVSDRHYLMVHGRIVETLSNEEVVHREGELLAHLGV